MSDRFLICPVQQSNSARHSELEKITPMLDAASIAMERSPRMSVSVVGDPVEGSVHWSPVKSIWYLMMAAGAIIGAPIFVTPGAVILFVSTTAITICLGHSLGMHRKLIHKSFASPGWLEAIFVYLGTLVGMAGPSGMIRQHDIRDWAQRYDACHPFLAHRNRILKDGWWQLNCELRLAHPPLLEIEPEVRNNRFYQFLDRTYMAQQLPWALLFFAIGGLPWLFWGIFMRVFLSLTGHWLIGYFAHNSGQRNWHLEGAGVQGYNIQSFSILTMGESLHNNHHAFPGSARLAHEKGEADPGWWVLNVLERVGLAWDVHLPETLPPRSNLVRLDSP